MGRSLSNILESRSFLWETGPDLCIPRYIDCDTSKARDLRMVRTRARYLLCLGRQLKEASSKARVGKGRRTPVTRITSLGQS